MLFIWTKEGEELAACGIPMNLDSISSHAAENVAPFF